MIFTLAERNRRWSLTRAMLQREHVDAVLARGTAAADDGQGHYRWLTSEGPQAGDSMVAVAMDDQALFARGGPPALWAQACSWFDAVVAAADINAGSLRDAGLATAAGKWLAQHGVRRLGLADLSTFPYGSVEQLQELLPGVELVELGPELLWLRNGKSAEELAVIEESGRLADAVWDDIHDLVAVGRPELEVLADVERTLCRGGCAGNFDIILHLNRGVDYDRQPSNRELQKGDAILFEISPRLHGYFTQLTSVVTLGPPTDELAAAFDASVRSRALVAPHIRPGVDVADISREIGDHVADMHHRVAGPSFGHMLGLELEEPRIGATSYAFAGDSTFVFHPVITTPAHPFVLRGDTYQVTEEGAVRLNRLSEEIIEI